MHGFFSYRLEPFQEFWKDSDSRVDDTQSMHFFSLLFYLLFRSLWCIFMLTECLNSTPTQLQIIFHIAHYYGMLRRKCRFRFRLVLPLYVCIFKYASLLCDAQSGIRMRRTKECSNVTHVVAWIISIAQLGSHIRYGFWFDI